MDVLITYTPRADSTVFYTHMPDGNGGFAPPVRHEPGPYQILRVAQLDTQPGEEIVVGLHVNAVYTLRVFRNDGSGQFTADNDIPLSTTVRDFTLADMDNDGNADLLINLIGQVEIRYGDGNGGFPTTDVFALPHMGRCIMTGDMNEDGLQDIYMADTYNSGWGGPVGINLSSPPGFVSGGSYSANGGGSPCDAIWPAPFGPDDNMLFMFDLGAAYNYDDPHCGSPVITNRNLLGGYPLAKDFDGDGRVDLMMLVSSSLRLFRGCGDVQIGPPTSIADRPDPLEQTYRGCLECTPLGGRQYKVSAMAGTVMNTPPQVFDLQGRAVPLLHRDRTAGLIDLNGLPAGKYLVRALVDHVPCTSKLIVNE
jgi:hypothetical protein